MNDANLSSGRRARANNEENPFVEQMDTEDKPTSTEIVNAYVNLLADGKIGYIADEKTLPYPKEIIHKALWQEILSYQSLRKLSEETFISCGYDKVLNNLHSLVVYLEGFKVIDEIDLGAVSIINQCVANQAAPPDWIIPIFLKYTKQENL